jgi:hypothetical protein
MRTAGSLIKVARHVMCVFVCVCVCVCVSLSVNVSVYEEGERNKVYVCAIERETHFTR